MRIAIYRSTHRIDQCLKAVSVSVLSTVILCVASGFVGKSARALPPATPVETQPVGVSAIVKRVELTGTVTSPHVSQISTSIEGLVDAVYFDNGAHVRLGEVLLKLDSELEQARLEQEKSRTQQAQAELFDAERRLKIAKRLAKGNYGPQNAVEERDAEIDIDRAALETFRAQEKRQAIVIERHTLKAPFDGVISKRMAEVGEWIQLGTPVFELVSLDKLRVDVAVPQQFYPQVRKDTEVWVAFEAVGQEQRAATVDAIIPVNDSNARTFTLRVIPRGKKLSITPGMSARVILNFKTADRGLVVSRDALIRHPDGRIAVWVLEDDGDKATVKERRIEIGLAFDGLVHVISGLNEGDRVVVRGNESLREGQVVRLAS